MTPETRENLEERAAIMEYCGGMARDEAEREALRLLEQQGLVQMRQETLFGYTGQGAAR